MHKPGGSLPLEIFCRWRFSGPNLQRRGTINRRLAKGEFEELNGLQLIAGSGNDVQERGDLD